VLRAFFLPLRYAQVLGPNALFNATPTVPFARKDKGREFSLLAQIALNIAVPACEPRWIGKRGPEVINTGRKSGLHADSPHSINRVQRPFDAVTNILSHQPSLHLDLTEPYYAL
jgi:hypothetical protein